MNKKIIAFILLLSMVGTTATRSTYAYSTLTEDTSRVEINTSSTEDELPGESELTPSTLDPEIIPFEGIGSIDDIESKEIIDEEDKIVPAETSEIIENDDTEAADNDQEIEPGIVEKESGSANQDELDQEVDKRDFNILEIATFTKGLYRNDKYYTGISLRNYLFSIHNRDFRLAVNQMDLFQAGSLNGVVDPIQGSMIGEAMIHTGFETSDFVKRSNLRGISLYSTFVDPEWPNPGAIFLDKNAKSLGDNTWEMELIIKGKDFESTNDIVLVLDNSNSNSQTKFKALINAAKEFGENLLTNDSTMRIAIVRVSEEIVDYTDYYTSSNLDAYLAYVSSIKQQTGEGNALNLQAGIHKGDEILYGSEPLNQKNMVILASAYPTFSYPFVGTFVTGTCTLTDHEGYSVQSGFIISDPVWPEPLEPDYEKIIGNGVKFIIENNNAYVDVTCQHGYTVRYPYGNFDEVENFTLTPGTDNGVGTIWEARKTREKGTNVFSIAFDADINGEIVLRDSASNSSNFYSIKKNDDVVLALENTFSSIASKTTIAAKNGTVIDPMGEMVDLIVKGTAPSITSNLTSFLNRQADIYTSQGTVSYSSADETITWDVGNINEGDDAVMKYRIKLEQNPSVKTGDGIYPNGPTLFSYTNYADMDTVKNFRVPLITVGGETVSLVYYVVNEEGNPINSAGIVVPIENAERLGSDDYTTILGIPYTFTAEQFDGYMYYGYILNGQQIKDVQTVSITTNSGGSPKLWFGYYKGKTSLKITKNGSIDDNQSFLFKVTGAGINLTVSVTGNGSVMIKDLPIGEYIVTEVTDWSFRYTPEVSSKKVTTVTSETKQITFTNTRSLSKWLSGESWLKNIFGQWKN